MTFSEFWESDKRIWDKDQARKSWNAAIRSVLNEVFDTCCNQEDGLKCEACRYHREHVKELLEEE